MNGPGVEDVDGPALQHVRRVRWLWKYNGTPERFAPYTLKPGDTVQIMDSDPVLDWLKKLPVDQSASKRPLKELPEPSKDSNLHEISEYLFNLCLLITKDEVCYCIARA